MAEETSDIIRPRHKESGRLRSYNQFPLHYADLGAMMKDLPRIKGMGFTSVWVNPLFEPCQSIEWAQQEIARGVEAAGGIEKDKVLHSKTGSPYATRSFEINSRVSRYKNEPGKDRLQKDYADIHAYTDAARKNGLNPLYDFVMRHVAVDNPLVKLKPHWFKRYDNGNFKFFGRNEDYHVDRQSWDDVLEFNYENPAVRREIINEYLKPMADIVINQFGFEGLRIDAAGELPREVYAEIIPYIDKLSSQKFGKPAIIIGETLGQNISNFMHLGGYMDYIYNSIYFQPFVREFWDHDDTWFSGTKGVLQNDIGPTIGFAGNHDVQRLADYYFNKQHIRGDLLRQVVTIGCMEGDIPLAKLLSIFSSLNDKNAFDPKELNRLVDVAHNSGLISNSAEAEARLEINEKGKLSLQRVRQWFDSRSLTDENVQATFNAMMDSMFTIVKQEKEKGIHEMRTSATQKAKKLIISENDFIRLLPGKLDEVHVRRLIKEAFCFTAFASDGGWFLAHGDEWGVTKKTSVFTASPADMQERVYPNMDLSDFVGSINKTLSQLPPPTNPEWVQRCYLRNGNGHGNGSGNGRAHITGNGNGNGIDKSFASFFIHQGPGYEGTGHLVIANVSDTTQIVDYETFMAIKDANGRNVTPEKSKFPSCVYLCGDISISSHLRTALESKNVRIFENNERKQETAMPIIPRQSDNIRPF